MIVGNQRHPSDTAIDAKERGRIAYELKALVKVLEFYALGAVDDVYKQQSVLCTALFAVGR